MDRSLNQSMHGLIDIAKEADTKFLVWCKQIIELELEKRGF